MRTRGSISFLTGLAFVTVALAGCFGGGDDKGTDAIDPAPSPTFGDGTGAIQGILVDEEVTPIPGAQVALRSDLSNPTTTDAAGGFVFSDLEPGPYQVEAQALGFAKKVQHVTVRAGEVTEITLKLVEVSIQGAPYSVTIGPVPGKFFCAFGFIAGSEDVEQRGLAGPCKLASLGGSVGDQIEGGYQEVADGERNIFEYPTLLADNATAESDQWATTVVELEWTPTSAAAATLNLVVEKHNPDGRTLEEPVYGSTSGASPVTLTLHPDTENEGADDGTEMPADETGFTVGVFPAFAEPPAVYTEQRFNVWITVFYNTPAPADFTILEDA